MLNKIMHDGFNLQLKSQSHLTHIMGGCFLTKEQSYITIILTAIPTSNLISETRAASLRKKDSVLRVFADKDSKLNNRNSFELIKNAKLCESEAILCTQRKQETMVDKTHSLSSQDTKNFTYSDQNGLSFNIDL